MRWLPYLSCLLVLGCGQAVAPPPASPASPPQQAAAAPAPPAPNEQLDLAPPPPAQCGDLVGAGPATPDCGADRTATLTHLAEALELSEPKQQEAALARLEACPELAPGLVRGLRAELAPVACGDAIVGDLPTTDADELSPPIRDALRGLALAAQLNRLVRDPPRLEPPFDKQRFDEFLKGRLAEWMLQQAHAIQKLAEVGASLEGYGKGIVAVEAGVADMRFVDVVRDVPLPEAIASDPELKDVYYGSLDQALEPRKQRGRDAALVGLKILADVGVLEDQRIDRARSLLSKLYQGRRIDALDGLMIPVAAATAPHELEERLAATLPTFYAGVVLREQEPGEPMFLQALLQRGLPRVDRDKLDPESLSPPARLLVARALFRSGQLYWRAEDFARVSTFLGEPVPGDEGETAKLLAAVAAALSSGPADAAQMMAKGPAPDGAIDVSGLDQLALSGGRLAGAAAFDAAFLLQLAPPKTNARAFWKDLEQRYRRAARQLDGASKGLALDAASAASETLKAIE